MNRTEYIIKDIQKDIKTIKKDLIKQLIEANKKLKDYQMLEESMKASIDEAKTLIQKAEQINNVEGYVKRNTDSFDIVESVEIS